jgi:septal ring factor EnvC (AmiA/AmiB activator)
VALESQIRESIKKSERVTEELRSKDRKVAALEQQVEDITRNLERMNGEIAAKDRLTGRYE